VGGVAGHLNHLYDDRSLTFNKIKKILKSASSGELIGTEKTDGYNIYLGYVGGQPRAARNKGDMSRGGMTFKDLVNREFQGGTRVKEIYLKAFQAYEAAIGSLSEEEKNIIFDPQGTIFYNAEIQGPGAGNVINYDANVISIHHSGHKRYIPETNKLEVISTEESHKAAKFLDSAISRFEEATQEHDFSLRRTAFLELNRLGDDYDLNIALQKIQKTGFAGNMTIEEFLNNHLLKIAEEKLAFLDGAIKQEVVDRILQKKDSEGKSQYKSLTQIYKGYPAEVKNEIKRFVNSGKNYIQDIMWPIEIAIHEFAVELLKGLKSAYVLNNDKELERLKKEVERAILEIQKYDGPDKEEAHKILVRQLEKLKNHDNVTTVVEGFVFQYGDTMYKFTGNFAPINQILGLFRYGRKGAPIATNSEDKAEADTIKEIESDVDVDELRGPTIVILPGAFKPPHRGHLDMIEHYSNIPEVDEVVVYISPISRKQQQAEVTYKQSQNIWDLYKPGIAKKSPTASPVEAAYVYASELAPKNANIILGASAKGGDIKRFAGNVEKYAREDVNILDPMLYVAPVEAKHSIEYMQLLNSNEEIKSNLPSVLDSKKDPRDLHAGDMRYLAAVAASNDIAELMFKDFIPAGVDPEAVLKELNGSLKENTHYASIFLRIIEEALQEEATVEPRVGMRDEAPTGEWNNKKKKKKTSSTGVDVSNAKKFKNKVDQEVTITKKIKNKIDQEVVNEDAEEIEEISAMAAGSVEGAHGKKNNKKDTLIREDGENEELIDEVLNYLLHNVNSQGEASCN